MADVVDMGRDAVVIGLGEFGRVQALDPADEARAKATMHAWRESQRRRARMRAASGVVLAMAACAALAWVVVPQWGRVGVEVDENDLLVQQGREQGARDSELATQGAAARERSAVTPPEPTEPPIDVLVPEVMVPEVIVPDSKPAPDKPRVAKPTPRVTESAGELLSAARDLAARGKLAAAASAYERLIATHPGASESKAALVSLGRVQASRGKHSAAVAMFTKYLAAGGGPLTEEAHWGKIGSLHALGRTADRDRAIESLASAHPRSVYLSKARALAGR